MLAVMLVADSRWTAARTRHHTLVLDRAYTDERELTDAVTRLLDASVLRVEVRDLDLVRDTTLVDVRYRVRAARPASVRGGAEDRPAIARPERMPEEALA